MTKFELSMKFTKEALSDMECIMKTQAMKDYMTSYIVSKKKKLDNIVKDTTQLLFDTSQPGTDPNSDELMHLKEFDGRRLKFMIKEGLDIEDENEKKKSQELKEKLEPSTKLMKE
eukprot:5189800-Heterocapsa_arctica.AAC.1